MTASTVDLAPPSRATRLGSLLRRALLSEIRVYTSIARAIARRPAVPIGGTGIAYHRPLLTILIVFIGLSAVEIPIVDLIVHRWPVVRIIMLVVGIWGVTWMVGLLCAMLMRPHTIGPDGVQVRSGLESEVSIAWDDIASIEISRRVDEPKQRRVTDGEYAERVQDETNIEIELEHPIAIRLPGVHPKGGVHTVARVRLWADDPRAFLAAARPFLTAAG
ncbi:hypothetical protein [Microbacterium sp. GCS4]|uniref:hypothetical protein n=1 Tax=Microbacterium sp. GCS4 TaxID=1692239 RepID=UPI0006830229|nr:hypothetical protein [Microbacterium sp. GCS4]KNY05736.1 hypothetical protein AKH00_07560 [Microbacterium sp. GCS4]